MLSLNQFAEEFRGSAAAVAANMDTSFAKGTPVVIMNPLQWERIETVEAELESIKNTGNIAVFDKDGREAPSNLISNDGKTLKIAINVNLPPFSFNVFDVRAVNNGKKNENTLNITKNSLENEKYRVKIDGNGDISGILDKYLNKEILKAPVRLAMFDYDGCYGYAAWEMEYKETAAKPREYAAHPEIEILESGPARVSMKIKRRSSKSAFTQIITLDKNGEAVKVFNETEWRDPRTLLKVELPLAAANPKAAYDLGLGVIERGNSTKKLYEFPAQMWADVTDKSGGFGVSVFSDSKTGWDKPGDNTIRLTALHTPKVEYDSESLDNILDFGLSRFGFAIYSHAGSYSNGTQKNAHLFNQPLVAFETEKHGGYLQSGCSFYNISDENVIVRAIKKAEDSDDLVVRFNEGTGRHIENVSFSVCGGISEAKEIYASEEFIQKHEAKDGKIVFDMRPFEVKSFMLKMNPPGSSGKPDNKPQKINAAFLEIPYNTSIATANGENADGVLPMSSSIPKELFPSEIASGGVSFKMSAEKLNAVMCKGQTLCIHEGSAKLYFVASSASGDIKTEFKTDNKTENITISDMFERIGIWDMYGLRETGRIKRDILAWNATHTHDKDGDMPTRRAYFFKYAVDLCGTEKEFILPDNENIIILAATAVKGEYKFKTAAEMYEGLKKRPFDFVLTDEEKQNAAATKRQKRYSRGKFLKRYIKIRIKREFARFKKPVKHNK